MSDSLNSIVGLHCHLVHDLRNAAGDICSRDKDLRIVRKQDTLGKTMYMVQEIDGTTYYLFRDEFELG
jgi:hypothetical protein